jgi:hypothetical protein
VEALIVLIVLFVVFGAALVAWKSWQRPGKPPALKPGPFHQLFPPKQAPKTPDQPTFTIQKPSDAGFKEISRTGGQRSRPSAKTGTKRTAGAPNTFGNVEINLTAVCKLTGKPVADCTCDRCKKIKKKA